MNLVAPPNDYDPARRTSRVHGSFVAKVQAAPGTRVAWFSAGASFAANVGAANETGNTISYAVGEPRDFAEIYRAAIPPDQSHWHYNVDREVKLASPARDLFIRYTGRPAVNNIRIYSHCLEESPRPSSTLLITHAWSENGASKTKQVRLEGEGAYEVEAGPEPIDEFIELAVPSGAAATRPRQRGAGQQN